MITTRALAMPTRSSLRVYGRDYGMLGVLALLIVVLESLDSTTLQLTNVRDVARQISITAMFAAGETLVILARQIDLSVGSTLGLAGVVSAGTLQRTNSVAAAIAVGLAVGAAVGLVNGILVAKGRLASFVVTLATLSIAAGLMLVYTGAQPIAVTNTTYLFIGEGAISGIPMPIVMTAVLYVLLWFILRRTKFGRYNYAIGGNEEAARLAGVPVTRYKLLIFVVAGLIAGLAGITLTARLGSGVPTLGAGYELDAITAVVLGGTSLFGGEGKIWGTLVGAAILELIGNGLNLLNVESFYQSIVTGIVVVLAISADRIFRGRETD
jgi:ribose/xylose/arabinose/galactoside ABC-type transport system permease subunit